MRTTLMMQELARRVNTFLCASNHEKNLLILRTFAIVRKIGKMAKFGEF